ncbi:MAG: GAF domain-containing protein [Tardiphaga sp.]
MNMRTKDPVRTPTSDDRDAEVLTTAQAAKLLGISVRTSQLLIEGGSLRSWKTPGGHRRVYRADVMALIGQPHSAPSLASAVVVSGSPGMDDAGSFPTAANEAARLDALERSGLVGTAPEPSFDRLTQLAGQFLKAPIALMTLLTPDRQWFKSRRGLTIAETPRSWAFCNHTVLQHGVFEVADLADDARFAANPAVAGDLHFRFYAGAPVVDPDGYALGSVCVIDRKPRHLDNEQKSSLLALAGIASDQIRLQAVERQLHAAQHPAP